jgi:OOP family OmpA-OmpF porin
MGKKSIILIMMIFVSMLSISRSLTTTEMRENTIRINALELVKVEKEQEQVKETPKKEIPKKVTVVMDERTLLFDFDKSVVKEQYIPILRNVIDYMVENNYDVTIVGHTDSKGSESYNEKLAMRRATSVKEKLLELGLSSDRIVGLEGRGELEPVSSNETEEGRSQNRRIEFNLVRRD